MSLNAGSASGEKVGRGTSFQVMLTGVWNPVSSYLWASHLTSLCLGLLLPSRFSRVRLCATPETAAYQAPLSPGFSRQEHWSGCHFLLQCMRVKSESEVAQSCLTSRSHELQPTRFLLSWDFPSTSTGVGCHWLLHQIPARGEKKKKATKAMSGSEPPLNTDIFKNKTIGYLWSLSWI